MNEIIEWYEKQDKLTRAITISIAIVTGMALLILIFSNKYTGIAFSAIALFAYLVFLVYTAIDDDFD